MAEQPPKLKFQYGKVYHCELLYDTPKTGEGQYGTWYMYGMKYEGIEYTVFTSSKGLNKRLERYRKGDQIVIEKIDPPDGGYPYYDVVPDEGTRVAVPETPKQEAPDWDAINDSKTKDIHRQVCLKLAVQSMGTTKKDLDLSEVASRMKGLLIILDGLIEEEAPVEAPAEEERVEAPPHTDDDLPF